MDHPSKPVLEYNQITDYIFLGTNMCCQTHFDKHLLQKGITADISLEAERAETPYGVQFYLWLPVQDFLAPTQEQLRLGVSALENFVAMKQKVYVHCKMGEGRSPTLVAAFLIKQGMNVEEAIQYIKSKRPIIRLSDIQMKALADFQKSV